MRRGSLRVPHRRRTGPAPQPADTHGGAALHADAETGLRAVYEAYAAEPDRQDKYARYDLPAACAVVVVTAPGKPRTVAWCGDARAYVLTPHGTVQHLTDDHNLRRVFQGNRNRITSCLGATETDAERKA
ncbi:hypothetical protein ABZ656_32370 [Streptomyces sp. NPDC007095]|uniref:hypothetical protein n=1 Tax=Streptomyces sp. NPDC007095 TaxID=3154482 RepID=UPI0033E9DC0E